MKKKSATKQELQIKLNSIRSELVWNYGYHFRKRLEAVKNNNDNDYRYHNQALATVMGQLNLYFDFDYKVMMNCVYGK